MKILICSDIHGSLFFTKKLQEIIKKEEPNKIIILGDLYYHGPRNPLTEEYNPMEVAKILNNLKENLIVIKGNCDAKVDEMISEFPMHEYYVMEINGKKIFFTHGHKWNKENQPEEKFDILVYGHFHTGFIEEENNKIFLNPGSISLPKNGTENSYAIITENEILLKNLNGKIIKKLDID